MTPHPFLSGARLYRTGDLARRDEAGRVEFLGRADLQIKLDGYRIEIGDIEIALRGLPGVREAAVAVHGDSVGGKQLTGYVVPEEGAVFVAAETQAALAAMLPRYMIPRAWVTLVELPLTPNRKLNRKALPAPDKRPEPSEATAPRTILEEAVAEVWKEAFGIAEVGVTTNFYDLGGHSLIATQIHARLLRIFQIELSLRDLFHNLTIESLAATLNEREPVPGRAVKIASAWLRVKRMTPEEKAEALADARAARTRSA
jgi:acyl carrier protein